MRDKDRTITELKLQEYMVENWKKIFPRLKLIEKNPAINGFVNKKLFGHADFLFQRGRKQLYLAELKYSDIDATDLWNSFKILGYCQMKQLATGKIYHPVIIIKKRIISVDIKAVLSALKISYITIERTMEGYFFEYDFYRKTNA
jgi:hypothetical protein